LKSSESNQSPDSLNDRIKLDEMEGYLHLKMKKEALQLARLFLKRPRLSAGQFSKCLAVIDDFTEKSKRWQALLEKAHGQLNRREQKEVRFEMLNYYSKRKNKEAVLRFLPKRINHRTSIVDIYLTWESWLENDRMKEMDKTVPVMSRAIQTAAYADMSMFLVRAYAKYWRLCTSQHLSKKG
jgi:hypothetical protein